MSKTLSRAVLNMSSKHNPCRIVRIASVTMRDDQEQEEEVPQKLSDEVPEKLSDVPFSPFTVSMNSNYHNCIELYRTDAFFLPIEWKLVQTTIREELCGKFRLMRLIYRCLTIIFMFADASPRLARHDHGRGCKPRLATTGYRYRCETDTTTWLRPKTSKLTAYVAQRELLFLPLYNSCQQVAICIEIQFIYWHDYVFLYNTHFLTLIHDEGFFLLSTFNFRKLKPL